MADQVQGSVTGGNGERLQVTLGTRSFGIQARDLIPVLLLIMMGVGGYLLYTNVHQSLQSLERNHEKIEQVLNGNAIRIVEAIQQANKHREEQTEAIRLLLLQHEFNQGREPEERIPLGLPPGIQPPPRTSGPLGEERR